MSSVEDDLIDTIVNECYDEVSASTFTNLEEVNQREILKDHILEAYLRGKEMGWAWEWDKYAPWEDDEKK